MSDTAKIPLIDIHSSLSHLAFAVSQTLQPLSVGVRITWGQHTYLCVEVGCYERDKQMVVDRLKHGALTGPYDYRFSVSYPTGGTDPRAWVTVNAYPLLSHNGVSL